MAEYIKAHTFEPSTDAPMKDLPQTIQDAASLAAAVEVEYLWVDALCINQGDVDDQRANISSMGAIYRNAVFTIVAAEGEGANAGLLRLRDCHDAPEQPTILRNEQGSLSVLAARRSMEEILRCTKWSTRGWTMQERILSDTCVFFTRDEVLFQSRTLEAREAYELIALDEQPEKASEQRSSSSRRRSARYHDQLLDNQAVPLFVYDNTIQEFTGRHLSHVGDRLDAFSGIAGYIHQHGSSSDKILAHAGLSERNFDRALFWEFTSQSPPTRIRFDTNRTRYLPSWSWVGWSGQCKIPNHNLKDFRPHSAKFLDSSNIVYDRRGVAHTWGGSSFESVPPSQPARTILHLWAGVVRCDIMQVVEHHDEGLLLNIAISSDDPSSTLIEVAVLSAQIARPTAGGEHRIIVYEAEHGVHWLLLVERGGEFFERLGVLHVGAQDMQAIAKRASPQWTRLQ